MKTYLFSLLRGTIMSRLAVALLVGTSSILSGCVSLPESPPSAVTQPLTYPDTQLADYLSSPCANIWQQDAADTLANPLYWLRGMECAQRLSPAEARAVAQQWPALIWQDTFKRGILLSPAKITPIERRRYMAQLDMLANDIPLPVRALFMVWRDGQRSLLSLAEERSRYTKLQQSTDHERDELRQHQQVLRSELELTSRKLEKFSDIERQLSRRKPGSNDISDAHSTVPQENRSHSPQETQP